MLCTAAEYANDVEDVLKFSIELVRDSWKYGVETAARQQTQGQKIRTRLGTPCDQTVHWDLEIRHICAQLAAEARPRDVLAGQRGYNLNLAGAVLLWGWGDKRGCGWSLHGGKASVTILPPVRHGMPV